MYFEANRRTAVVISIPLGAIISITFDTLNSPLINFNSSWCDYKAIACSDLAATNWISIPLGAIIRVRRILILQTAKISIPLGAIIRYMSLQPLDMYIHFNSSWCDYKVAVITSFRTVTLISIPLGAIISKTIQSVFSYMEISIPLGAIISYRNAMGVVSFKISIPLGAIIRFQLLFSYTCDFYFNSSWCDYKPGAKEAINELYSNFNSSWCDYKIVQVAGFVKYDNFNSSWCDYKIPEGSSVRRNLLISIPLGAIISYCRSQLHHPMIYFNSSWCDYKILDFVEAGNQIRDFNSSWCDYKITGFPAKTALLNFNSSWCDYKEECNGFVNYIYHFNSSWCDYKSFPSIQRGF